MTTPTVVHTMDVSVWPEVSAIIRPADDYPAWEVLMTTRTDDGEQVIAGGAVVGLMTVGDLDELWTTILSTLVDEVEGLDA